MRRSHKPAKSIEPRLVTVVDDDKLEERYIISSSTKQNSNRIESSQDNKEISTDQSKTDTQSIISTNDVPVSTISNRSDRSEQNTTDEDNSRLNSISSLSMTEHHNKHHNYHHSQDHTNSPPAEAIIIPPDIVRSLSNKTNNSSVSQSLSLAEGNSSKNLSKSSNNSISSKKYVYDKRATKTHLTTMSPKISDSSRSDNDISSKIIIARNKSAELPPSSAITQEQFDRGKMLGPDEVQILYRNPHLNFGNDVELGEHKSPTNKQSPVAFMISSINYKVTEKPLIIEYNGPIENLRLNNTGIFWDVLIPYQVTLKTVSGGLLMNSKDRYRLHQFHCHWGANDRDGSEHTVDSRRYSAELHFVHYNLDKYKTLTNAVRQTDGLVALAIFLEAQDDYRNHPELQKIAMVMKDVRLKGQHTIIKQPINLHNFLPRNRSYWSYHGSLTTAPYYESVLWFVMKEPIKCNSEQLRMFRTLQSTLKNEDDSNIISNRRDVQPLNGRDIFNYEDSSTNTELKKFSQPKN